jgi:anti-sigma regulatory factor (Ser/Thr protein kinase)
VADSVDPPAGSVLQPAEMSYAVPADLTVVRDFVRAEAVALGLPDLRADLLTVAVSELATNTLQHTAGGGLVRIWAEPGRVCCEVVDQGAARTFGRTMPGAEEVRGRGLAIVERICDEVGTGSGPAGTSVRLGMLN